MHKSYLNQIRVDENALKLNEGESLELTLRDTQILKDGRLVEGMQC